jgi:hypothetical protein
VRVFALNTLCFPIHARIFLHFSAGLIRGV